MRLTLSAATAFLLLGCLGAAEPSLSQEESDEEERALSHQELVRLAARTSIVWISNDFIEKNANISAQEVADSFIKEIIAFTGDKTPLLPNAVFQDLHVFTLPMAPIRAQAVVDGLMALKVVDDPKTDQEKDDKFRRDLGVALSVSSDMIVSIADADCSDDDVTDLTTSSLPITPPGVTRVHGGGALPAGYVPKVWVIDSGLDNSSNYITVDTANAINCHVRDKSSGNANAWKCDSSKSWDDKIGHGTMIAGIIAGNPPSGGKLKGIAPGITVVPVKIFGNSPEVLLSGPPLKALEHVAGKANAGDVVNMSWGAAWLENLYRKKNLLETVMGFPQQANPTAPAKPGMIDALRGMVTAKSLRLVVAAGNVDLATRPSLVSFVAPATLGSYPRPGAGTAAVSDGCMICTVAAIDSADRFWWDDLNANPVPPDKVAEYGSAYGRNPPDFAEPGKDIWSLWPAKKAANVNRANKCSGTSFAAAHLSGVLARMTTKSGSNLILLDPAIDGRATGDPDVAGVSPPGDPSTADPIGIATR